MGVTLCRLKLKTMKQKSAYMDALKDIASYLKTVEPDKTARSENYVLPSNLFSKTSRLLNRNLGIHKLNKDWGSK